MEPIITGDRPSTEIVDVMERSIRDMAATVLSQTTNRREHPSYGYGKTMIRAQFNRLEGAVGLYMVVTLQAVHTSVPTLATFTDPETEASWQAARRAIQGL